MLLYLYSMFYILLGHHLERLGQGLLANDLRCAQEDQWQDAAQGPHQSSGMVAEQSHPSPLQPLAPASNVPVYINNEDMLKYIVGNSRTVFGHIKQ